jgi:hypothetical protein
LNLELGTLHLDLWFLIFDSNFAIRVS